MEHEKPTRSGAVASQDYATSYTVEQSPDRVFAAIVDVRGWWTGRVDGITDEVGSEFAYRHPPQHYSRQRIIELNPARRVVWEVTESDLSFTAHPDEWTGTRIVFEITPAEQGGSTLHFTHIGLVPDVECFGACSAGWLHYVSGSLRSLITTGTGLPDPW
jgi:hypothetical protein